MITKETKIRVRYADTDQMGVVYHGKYADYYEVGRTELIREFGLTYRDMEESGIMMPVVKLNIRYKQPAKYDELLTIITTLKEIPSARITFEYQIKNEEGILLSTGEVTLVFTDMKTRRPTRPPKILMDALQPFFSETL